MYNRELFLSCVQSWGDYNFGVQVDFIQSQSVKHTSDVRLLVVIDTVCPPEKHLCGYTWNMSLRAVLMLLCWK